MAPARKMIPSPSPAPAKKIVPSPSPAPVKKNIPSPSPAPSKKIVPSPTLVTVKQEPDVDTAPAPTVMLPLPAPTAMLPLPAPTAMLPLPAPTPPPTTSTSHPDLLSSMDELQGLTSALSVFTQRWNELQSQIDSVQASIDTVSREIDSSRPILKLSMTPVVAAVAAEEVNQGAKIDSSRPTQNLSMPPAVAEEDEEEEVEEEEEEEEAEEEEERKNEKGGESSSLACSVPRSATIVEVPCSKLEAICKSSNSKALGDYVMARLSDVEGLLKEVPEALKLAARPARLVLRCFRIESFLKGRKEFDGSDAILVDARNACILLLEFLLLSGSCSTELEPSDRQEATQAALAWKARIVNEGGIANASSMDALGLILFVASYGIPPEFSSYDLYNLFRLCNLKTKASILLRSPILVEKLPDIIQDMVNKGMHIEAVDLVFSFGLQEKFPPLALVTSFLHDITRYGIGEREGQCSIGPLKGAYEKELAAIRAAARCLKEYGLHHPELSSFNISQRIAKLEKEISKCEEGSGSKSWKRKSEAIVVPLTREKHSRATVAETPVVRTQQSIIPAQEQVTAVSDSKGLYISSSSRNWFGRNVTGQSGTGNSLGSTAVGGGPAGQPGIGNKFGSTVVGDQPAGQPGTGNNLGSAGVSGRPAGQPGTGNNLGSAGVSGRPAGQPGTGNNLGSPAVGGWLAGQPAGNNLGSAAVVGRPAGQPARNNLGSTAVGCRSGAQPGTGNNLGFAAVVGQLVGQPGTGNNIGSAAAVGQLAGQPAINNLGSTTGGGWPAGRPAENNLGFTAGGGWPAGHPAGNNLGVTAVGGWPAGHPAGNNLGSTAVAGGWPAGQPAGNNIGFTAVGGWSAGQPVGNKLGSTAVGGWPEGHPAGNNLGSTAGGHWSAGQPAGNNLGSTAFGGWPANGALNGWLENSSYSLVARSLSELAGSSAESGYMVPPEAAVTSSFGLRGRNPGSSLYQFADTLMENELHDKIHGKGSALGTATGYNRSYFR